MSRNMTDEKQLDMTEHLDNCDKMFINTTAEKQNSLFCTMDLFLQDKDQNLIRENPVQPQAARTYQVGSTQAISNKPQYECVADIRAHKLPKYGRVLKARYKDGHLQIVLSIDGELEKNANWVFIPREHENDMLHRLRKMKIFPTGSIRKYIKELRL